MKTLIPCPTCNGLGKINAARMKPIAECEKDENKLRGDRVAAVYEYFQIKFSKSWSQVQNVSLRSEAGRFERICRQAGYGHISPEHIKAAAILEFKDVKSFAQLHRHLTALEKHPKVRDKLAEIISESKVRTQ